MTFESRPKGVRMSRYLGSGAHFTAEGKRKDSGVRASLAYRADSRKAAVAGRVSKRIGKEKKVKGVIERPSKSKIGFLTLILCIILLRLVSLSHFTAKIAIY